MKTYQIRVGEDFLKYKNRLKKDLQIKFGRNFSDAEITNLMAHFYRNYNVVKLGKKRVTYV